MGEQQVRILEEEGVEVNAAILEYVIRAAPASTRAFHPAGMADPSPFAAMSCDEFLIHTADIATGFEIDFRPSEDLCSRVLARLFPWAPANIASLCFARMGA